MTSNQSFWKADAGAGKPDKIKRRTAAVQASEVTERSSSFPRAATRAGPGD